VVQPATGGRDDLGGRVFCLVEEAAKGNGIGGTGQEVRSIASHQTQTVELGSSYCKGRWGVSDE
jgi:hypothetical protein